MQVFDWIGTLYYVLPSIIALTAYVLDLLLRTITTTKMGRANPAKNPISTKANMLAILPRVLHLRQLLSTGSGEPRPASDCASL